MAQFSVKTGQIRPLSGDEARMAQELAGYVDSIGRIANNLSLNSWKTDNIRARLRTAFWNTSSYRAGMSGLSSALTAAMDRYDNAERRIVQGVKEGTGQRDVWGEFASEFGKNFGWKEILKGSGYIGTICNLIGDISNIKSANDAVKASWKTAEFLTGAVRTAKNYRQIGNAVGKKTAACWWVKKITGLKPLGRVSTASNPIARFANNLTNKTSPYNIKNSLGNFTGANGAGKAAASWASVAISGFLNFQANKEEQRESGGKMSDGRVWAETITETVVDTLATHAGGLIIGAAVAAVSPVALPGVVVAAAGGLLVSGVNAGVKALTGKTATEWVSDGIVDIGEGIGQAAGKAVGAAAKWVSDGVSSIGKNVGNTVNNIGNSIAKWFGKK